MPELPDITVYVHALSRRIEGHRLDAIRLKSPFLLRTVNPSVHDLAGKQVVGVRRLGKRIVVALETELFLVLHLMIAGRLQWKTASAGIPGRIGLAAFDFDNGALLLVETSKKKRAALHLVRGAAGLAALDRGGLEVLEASLTAFATALRSERHTLKRALTDPRLFSGIGNAYSDEILHAARLSPARLTQTLTDGETTTLFAATQETLRTWTARLLCEAGDDFPSKVTAFRAGMRVHGRYDLPCLVCGARVQRIRYADHETNYCATCQCDGKLLADRSLSRLLKRDWPKTIEELEALKVENG
jgi:formamidopyrimidine-DNA glycosylase